MNTARPAIILVFMHTITAGGLAADESPREVYLRLATAAYDNCRASCENQIEQWRSSYQPTEETGYCPPPEPVWLASLAASLYDVTGREEYAREAVRLLARHHEYKPAFPESLRTGRPEFARGLPTLTDFYQVPYFARAYLQVRDAPAMTDAARQIIQRSIAESVEFTLAHAEWGPMNRAMLRAEGFMLAAEACPDHPQAANWGKLARLTAADSRGQWSEEDSAVYLPVWINSMIRYADFVEDPSWLALPTFSYYFEYFLRLLAPTGMVPDYGDARWTENWAEYVACFERGAREYRRGDLRWAAGRLIREGGPGSDGAIDARMGVALLDAYRWADETIQPQMPSAGSQEAVDDLVGKKIVFRSGWESDADYLMLNYRDEGAYARVPRECLRQTIPAEEEKMHHGHADENAICLLMSGGSVLLHDGGYRDGLPSGQFGAYRADYYHNRLVVRPYKKDADQPLFEFLRHSGGYVPVRTEKIDFFTSEEVDVGRTRLLDDHLGYSSDRVIVYVKPSGMYLVFDIVTFHNDGFYTLATLWHATEVFDRSDSSFVTGVDTIAGWTLPKTKSLLIAFLEGGDRKSGVFDIRRHRQDESAVFQTIASHYYAGQREIFVTALIPHARGANTKALLDSLELLEMDAPREGIGIKLTDEQDVRYVCVKKDLANGVLAANIRPRYTFDSGRVRYGPVETDASFAYAHVRNDTLSFLATHMVKVLFGGREVFSARPNTFWLQPNGSPPVYGLTKWRMWYDTVPLAHSEEPRG